LNQSDAYIANSTRLMSESHTVGVATLGVMDEQGHEILQVAANVDETRSSTTQARQILRRMATTALYNKVFLWLVIVSLFLADVLFLYYGFLKSD